MEKTIKLIATVLGVIATLATLVMMVSIAIDVVFRALYNRTVPGVLEISETALVCAVFLGLAYTGATNSHIAVDLLTERLPRNVERWAISIAWALSTLFLGWILYATLIRAMASTQEGEARMGLVSWPIWPARWIIVIGLAAMLLVSIANLIRAVKGEHTLGIIPEERVSEIVEHPYEYVIGESDDPTVADGVDSHLSDAHAAQLANQQSTLEDDRKDDR